MVVPSTGSSEGRSLLALVSTALRAGEHACFRCAASQELLRGIVPATGGAASLAEGTAVEVEARLRRVLPA